METISEFEFCPEPDNDLKTLNDDLWGKSGKGRKVRGIIQISNG